MDQRVVAAPARGGFARYTGAAVFFHWVIAAMIAANVLIMWVLDALPQSQQRPMVNFHKSIGLTVLGLAIMRVLWRLANPPPPLPAGTEWWERRASHAAHLVLYGLIFALPLSGWIHDSAWSKAAQNPLTLYGVIPWFRIGPIAHLPAAPKEQVHAVFSEIHTLCAYLLYAVFVLHVAGALKHSLLDRRPSLRRMWIG